MGKFKQKLYRFFSGRNGVDQLYYFCLGFMIFLMVADAVLQTFLPNEWTGKLIIGLCMSLLTMAVFIWSIFRVMSRNLFKRRMENAAFLKIWRGIKRFFCGNTSKRSKSGNRDNATYIFRDCTKCGATLRLPRKVGKHRVKCPRCSHSFKVKAKEYKNR